MTLSRLYALQPINLGTKDCESITSFMVRLAEAHSITLGSLISNEIAPLLKKEYLSRSMKFGGSRFFENSSALLGVGESAEDIVNLLGILTRNDELYALTILPWRAILASRKLIRQKRAWCPICFEELRIKGALIYEPLSWNLQAVKICPTHNVKLLTVCPKCGQENYIITRKSRVGFCNICGCWLGSVNNVAPELITEWDSWIIKNVADLLSIPAGEIDIACYSKILSNIIKNHFGESQKAFSRALNLPLTNIRAWRHGVKPGLENLLGVSYCLGVSLKDLLSWGQDTEKSIELRKITWPIVQNHCTRKPFEYERVMELLKRMQCDKRIPPVSLKQVSAEIGYDRRMIRRHFPEQCKLISKKYLNFLADQKVQRIKESSKNIEVIIDGLHSQGIYPSTRKIEFMLKPSILRENSLQFAWKEKLKQLFEYV